MLNKRYFTSRIDHGEFNTFIVYYGDDKEYFTIAEFDVKENAEEYLRFKNNQILQESIENYSVLGGK